MRVNAVATVIRTDDNGNYISIGAYPCMWQETEAYETKKYGEERADTACIYIPNMEADIAKGDYITRDEIGTNIDVSDMLTVTSVNRRDYGSSDMRHIEVGAK